MNRVLTQPRAVIKGKKTRPAAGFRALSSANVTCWSSCFKHVGPGTAYRLASNMFAGQTKRPRPGLHLFRCLDAEDFEALLQHASGQITQNQPRGSLRLVGLQH